MTSVTGRPAGSALPLPINPEDGSPAAMIRKSLLALSLAGCALLATAPVAAAEPPDPLILNSSGFLDYHPDMRYRLFGVQAHRRGDIGQAMKYFRRAARYADKPSQAMIAEMLWTGAEDVAQDRAAAYAWMDLAAERHFRMMLAKREAYWAELTEAERARALELGEALYAEYGDQAAKPRLESKLRQGRSKVTGSRTGSAGNLQITLFTANGIETIDGSKFYDRKLWHPEKYWEWQDEEWNFHQGVVDVGPMIPSEDAAEADADDGD